MRRTTSKSRKTINDEQEEQSNNSASLQMELELLALKAKNVELTKAHAKLTHENSEMRNEILALRGELIDMETRSNILATQLENIMQDMRKCTPSLIDMLNLFLQFSESRKSSVVPTVRIFNRFSDKGCSPKSKAITHTVKPHTVNGTVLNLNPTISLTRLNPVNQRSDEEPSSSTSNIDYRNSLPSTSSNGNHMRNTESGISEIDHSFVANDDFVPRKSHARNKTSIPDLINPDFSSQMEIENEVEPEEEVLLDSSPVRLSTIHEESVCSTSGQTRTSLGEIRIYLSRLSAEDMQTKRFLNDTCTSTEANVNDTCFNIETTVIENQEALVNKRLRADIMVFSPHTNSTRLNTPMFDNGSSSSDTLFSYLQLSPRMTGCNDNVSVVQSSEVTPSSSNSNECQGNGDPSWIPTPSMSAMGDIDRSNYSRLEILTEPERKLSPAVPPSSALITKSRLRRKGSEHQNDGDSPRSSRGGDNHSTTTTKFVSRQRGGRSDSICTPTIILERLASSSPLEHRPTQNLSVNDDSDPSKENKNISNNENTRSRRSQTKSTSSKSPKQAVKRKKTASSNDFQEKIREVQIRLSNYVPESLVNPPESRESSSDDICAPTMILGRLANGPVENRPIQSLAVNSDSDPPKENEIIPNNESTRSKRSKTKSTSKSPKQHVKRRKTSSSNDFQDKIREVQIRLSNYVSDSSLTPSESPDRNMSRPTRAAKPKVLKDPSLKTKLRRMF